jgi:outer membrane protein TolC
VEVRGQRQYRRRAAGAALTRTDWEISAQEVALAVRVGRAFDAVVYQQDKLELVNLTLRLNQQGLEQADLLFKNGKIRGIDVIIARTEANDSRAQVDPARVAYTKAWQELLRALGTEEASSKLQGTLESSPSKPDAEQLLAQALARRPDLRARQAALEEAEARVRLAVADRYGNPNIGPAYEYDYARVNLIGAQFSLPFPVFNTHRGEIYQRQAEQARAGLELRQTEVTIHRDVAAALARLDAALHWVETYRKEILPQLQKGLDDAQKLFAAGDPGVDVLRVLDVRRKLLKARDVYLDALWEVRQAESDLTGAVGDPFGIPASGQSSDVPKPLTLTPTRP